SFLDVCHGRVILHERFRKTTSFLQKNWQEFAKEAASWKKTDTNCQKSWLPGKYLPAYLMHDTLREAILRLCGWSGKVLKERSRGREDSNLRPLGPEPEIYHFFGANAPT